MPRGYLDRKSPCLWHRGILAAFLGCSQCPWPEQQVRLQGGHLQHPNLFRRHCHSLVSWQHGRAANPSEIAWGCEKVSDPSVALEEGGLEAPEGPVRADLPHCSTPVPPPLCQCPSSPNSLQQRPTHCSNHFSELLLSFSPAPESHLTWGECRISLPAQ